MKLFFLSVIFFISLSLQTFTQTAERSTVSGYVKEEGSGETLIGVNIYVPGSKTGTVTNNFGFYSLTLPSADTIEIAVSYVGFSTREYRIPFQKNTELNIELKPGLVLDEVTITADKKERLSESARMSTIKLPVQQIRNVPMLLGEKDVLKVIQLMPGIQKGSEGSSGLYVRGGGPDQNLIILDDAIVYNASHLFGFFSLFNGSALKSVELTKGGFPARYGGRLSSVLEMNMKEGNKEEWHGEGGIGLISSNLTIEGPLKKDKSSLLLSGRRTYADLILRPVLNILDEENTGYYFYDFNAKINYDFGRKNKLYLSGYFGKDKFYEKYKSTGYSENVGFLWGNSTATLRWNHLFSNKMFANTSAIFSHYSFGIYDDYKVVAESKDYYAEYYSGIRDFTLKSDIDFLPNPNHWIKAGIISIFHRFNPYAYVEEDVPRQVHKRKVKYMNSIETGIYAEDTWQPFQALKVNAGFRFSYYIATEKHYFNPEPRLSLALRLSPDLAMKASYASMNQYIHLLSNTGINLPTDLWVPATDRVKPQSSRQIAMGIVKDIDKNDVAVSLEGYYKTMNNVLAYKEGASFVELNEPSDITASSWEDNVTAGHSWSYGAEFLIQKKAGKFTGWIGYTLSWTRMQFDSLNFGKEFYARYDRRHDISIVAMYNLNNHINISGTWVYGTGNAVTLPLSSYWAEPHRFLSTARPDYENSGYFLWFYPQIEEFGEKNNYRMKAYHRLDLGIQFHKNKKWGERIWEISVYNAYCRFNPFYYYRDVNFENNKEYGVLKQVSLFPVIPSFTYSFRF
jgi:CarboxypepD_reg-like domain/TonB-dependent Receptor Plug Domain